MVVTSVRWFHSEMPNAPTLNGQPGSLLAVLAACLEDGFDIKVANSIVVSSGVATATISAGHSYDVAAVIRIDGATPSTLNGDWRIAATTATTFTFLCPGIADGNATGTITCKRAPAGWEKVFSASGKAAYRSPSLIATRLFLRVDDGGTTVAKVRGYENMTSVDDGVNPFPTIGTFPETSYLWAKSSAANETKRNWVLICDDAMIYLLTRYSTGSSYTNSLYWFGDIVSYIPGDAFNCSISATGTTSPSFPGHILGSMGVNRTDNGGGESTERLARRADQVTKGQTFARMAPSGGSGIAGSFGLPPYPGPGGALNLFYPIPLTDFGATFGTTVPMRGHMPGMAVPMHVLPLTHLQTFDGGGVFEGRKMMMCAADFASTEGRVAFDLIGPWR